MQGTVLNGNNVNGNGKPSATAAPQADNNGRENKIFTSDSVINLDQGDPMVFEAYWKKAGEESDIVIPGWRSMSYFAGKRKNTSFCWYMEGEFEEEVRRIHQLVGNAVTEDRHIVVGNGSMQLFQAALYAYALSFPVDGPDSPHPISVVCATPYYSSYGPVTDFLKSGLYKWEGDANSFEGNGPYIEVITTPNNPDGSLREAVVNRKGDGDGAGRGMSIYDLAYYWPHYTAITTPADHDMMLFTLSKCTGHAGSRIGWAVVKDREIAVRMTKFMELSTIGVSKDSQLRAAKILRTISDGCERKHSDRLENGAATEAEPENFFEYGRNQMTKRWDRLRNAIKDKGFFSLPEYPKQFCNFSGDFTEAHPSFAWLKVEEEGIEDCEGVVRGLKILNRSGKNFGSSPRYTRISMVDREDSFNPFLERLSSLSSSKLKSKNNGVVNGQ